MGSKSFPAECYVAILSFFILMEKKEVLYYTLFCNSIFISKNYFFMSFQCLGFSDVLYFTPL